MPGSPSHEALASRSTSHLTVSNGLDLFEYGWHSWGLQVAIDKVTKKRERSHIPRLEERGKMIWFHLSIANQNCGSGHGSQAILER